MSWGFNYDFDYAFQQRARTAGVIGLGVMTFTLVVWTIATPIIGHETTGKVDGFVNHSLTALCGFMLQHKIASYAALSTMAAVNIGVITGAGYFAVNKAKERCSLSSSHTPPSPISPVEYDFSRFS